MHSLSLEHCPLGTSSRGSEKEVTYCVGSGASISADFDRLIISATTAVARAGDEEFGIAAGGISGEISYTASAASSATFPFWIDCSSDVGPTLASASATTAVSSASDSCLPC